jgi:hypothetical protein
MIKEINKDTKEINLDRLMGFLKEAFDHTSCRLFKSNENTLTINYVDEQDSWNHAILVVKQPVVFLYGEFGNLLMYGMPEDQEDFESNFAKACYKILNELQ